MSCRSDPPSWEVAPGDPGGAPLGPPEASRLSQAPQGEGGEIPGPPEASGEPYIDPAVARARVMACVAALADLADTWDPIAMRCESAVDALAGSDGLSHRQMILLEQKAARWTRLDPRLRTMYAVSAKHSDAARIALWQLLIADKPRHISGFVHSRLTGLWVDTHGYPPSISLFPLNHARGGET